MGAGTIIEKTLDELVRAVCADYERRRRLIEAKCMPRRVDMELRYLNFKIYDAASEIVGEADAQNFINEIGKKIGYAKTCIIDLSEATYKVYKRGILENIAKRLYLIGE